MVARRTLYQHKKKGLLDKKTFSDSIPVPDPFDADVSSPEDDREMVLGVDGISNLSSNIASDDQSNGFEVPPSKNAKLNKEVSFMLMHVSDNYIEYNNYYKSL